MIGMSEPTIAILEILAERPRASRAELAEATGLSPATVGRTVGRLRRDGVLREYALDAAGVGRPPRVVELDDRSAFVIGIDAGGRTLRAAIADLGGTFRGRIARPVRDPADREALVDDLVALVAELAAGVRPGAVQAVVAGVSGIVDHGEGRVLLSPDLPGLAGLALAAALEGHLGLPVGIDNDDLLAAIGEATTGAAAGCRDVVFLSLGYGLGAGLIVGGRPVRGASNAAGAIAFLSPGRLEDRASGRAIPARYRAAVLAAGSAGASDPGDAADARAVFELAATGNPIAIAVVDGVVTDLGDLVVDVAAVLDPEVIVIGGGLADAGTALFGPLGSRIREALPYPPRIVASALEGAAVLHGATSLALALARRRLAGLDPSVRPESEHSALSLL
jgi:predicted NBD/HSP70 family sugar kinase